MKFWLALSGFLLIMSSSGGFAQMSNEELQKMTSNLNRTALSWAEIDARFGELSQQLQQQITTKVISASDGEELQSRLKQLGDAITRARSGESSGPTMVNALNFVGSPGTELEFAL